MITLAQAKHIIKTAFTKGAELNLKPLSVAVLDSGGHLMAFERQDGASTMRLQIASGKAAGALALGISSRKIGEMAEVRPAFVGALAQAWPQGVMPAAGGLAILDDSNTVIGAVGVTGDTSDQDELCTIAAIEAAGFKPQI